MSVKFLWRIHIIDKIQHKKEQIDEQICTGKNVCLTVDRTFKCTNLSVQAINFMS